MEKVIHIVNDDGIEFDVAVTEEELASFRDAAAQAAETGQQLEFDDWAFHELHRKHMQHFRPENDSTATA